MSSLGWLDAAICLTAIGLAASVRPWRQLGAPGLRGPFACWLVLLPLVWSLPQWSGSPLPVHLSGAALALLMLGWPMCVGVLIWAGLASWALRAMSVTEALGQTVWLGLLPATLAMAFGAVLRRTLPRNLFVYVLGRGFFGSAVCLFLTGLLAYALQPDGLPLLRSEMPLVATWLMAWGDAFLTGMLVAIFVAYRPQWLATWSDARYLKA